MVATELASDTAAVFAQQGKPWALSATYGCACRPFNPGEAKDAGASVERENRRLTDGSVYYLLNGKQRFTQGYLQRTFAISSLRICETLPPLDELQRFKQAGSPAKIELHDVDKGHAVGKR